MLPDTIIQTAPATEVIDLVQAKQHCRVWHNEEDTLLAFYCAAARRCVEKITGRALITQTIQAWWSEFPTDRFLELPYPRLKTITHLKYTDSTGSPVTTWAGSNYIADIRREPGLLVLANNISWPSSDLYPANGVEVQFTAGYGDSPDDVPEDIRAAILLLVGHLYRSREEVVIGNNASAETKILAFGARDLLANYRIF